MDKNGRCKKCQNQRADGDMQARRFCEDKASDRCQRRKHHKHLTSKGDKQTILVATDPILRLHWANIVWLTWTYV